MTTDTMRIGYLTSQYPAASHTFIRREVAALRAHGLPIATYSVRRGDVAVEDADSRADADSTYTLLDQSVGAYAVAHLTALAAYPVRYIRTLTLASRHRVPGMRALLWSLFHFAEAILLARQLRRDSIGHLHNHFANPAATVGLLATHFAGMSWSLTLHGISEFDYPAGLLLADKIAAARFVACVSRFGMAQAMRLTDPALWPRLHLVRCGIDLTALPPRSAQHGAGDQLVCIGRLSSEKGHAGLVKAFAAVRRRRPSARLTLVGDGPERARLAGQVTAAGLADAVIFAGRLDEAATLRTIAAGDMLMLPSFMEGLPVVLMEAMALDVPVVAARVAGVPELVRDGESGLLFDPADWDALADAIIRLIDDGELRRRLAAAARVVIEGEFAIDVAVEPLLGLFADTQERT